MTLRRRKPSPREVHNHLQGLDALYNNATPVFKEKRKFTRKPYAEREESSNDALKEWRRTRGDVRIWRNNVGAYEYAPRKWVRYGLCNGSSDFIGLYSMVVTPEMVGRKVAVFFAPESKARGKDAEDHQEKWMKEIREAGGIAGVARNGEEADALIRRWLVSMAPF